MDGRLAGSSQDFLTQRVAGASWANMSLKCKVRDRSNLEPSNLDDIFASDEPMSSKVMLQINLLDLLNVESNRLSRSEC